MLKLKKLNIDTTQGFSGELRKERQFVFNYRTDDPGCEIALTMPPTGVMCMDLVSMLISYSFPG